MKKAAYFLKKYYFEILLVLPMSIYILGFTIFPIFQSIGMGLTDKYTGKFTLDNYLYLFQRPNFTKSIFNTVFTALASLVFQLIIGLGIATILKKQFKGKGIIRALVLMPMGIPTLVSGVIAIYIFGTSGYLNEVLYRLGLVTTPIQWTKGGILGLLVIILADTWKVLPTMVLLLLSGLESIPGDLYEAADIDGAGKWQTFKSLTLPMLMPFVSTNLILSTKNMLMVFDQIMALTKGGPAQSTESISYLIYKNGMDGGQFGFQSANAVVFFVVIVTISIFQMAVTNKKEEQL